MAKAPARLHLNPKQMALVGGIVIVGLFLFGYTSRLIASSEAQSEVAQWQQEVDLAKQRLAENQARLEYAKTDAFVIEKAHSDLGWAFPARLRCGSSATRSRRSRRLQPMWSRRPTGSNGEIVSSARSQYLTEGRNRVY